MCGIALRVKINMQIVSRLVLYYHISRALTANIIEYYGITFRMEPGLARFVHFSPHTLSEPVSLFFFFRHKHSCSAVTFEKAPWPKVVSDVGSCICSDRRREQHTDGRSATTCRTIQVAGFRCAHEYIGQKKQQLDLCLSTPLF